MSNIPLSAPVVSATVDWVSVSCNRPMSVAAFFDWRDATFSRLEEDGYVKRPWGTHGWQGEAMGPVRFGAYGGAVIVQVSGSEAQRNWWDLVMESTNVSRIDLAATVRPYNAEDSLARAGHNAAKRLPKRVGRPIEYTLIDPLTSSETLVVGKRSSDEYGRLYNKEVESGDPAYKGCWRYEVEYKRKVANARARSLLKAPQEKEAIAGDVYRWFSRRGVDPCFWPGYVEALDEAPARVPDDERWLNWVRKAVQPRAREMVHRYGWRFVAEACVGRIDSYESWETMIRDIELELDGRE